jgi:Protein of unknown function (DUF3467)
MNGDQEQPAADSGSKRKQIKLTMPKDLKPVYANIALISHAPSEMVIEFAQVLPRIPHGTIQARVIMTPMHAKMLHMALTHNLANYEKKFGKIPLPQQSSTLADNFFRFPQEGSGDESDGGE